jgi:hypothetical protein
MPGEPLHAHLTDRDNASIAQYRPLSGLAVAALIVALAAPLALLSPLLWVLPALGIVLSAAALWRIARGGSAMIGRKAAMFGLALSVVMAAAAPADALAYRWLLHREARRLAECWFAQLADGQPQQAHQLTLVAGERRPWDDKLWDFYRNSPHYRADLENYVAEPLIRTLLALGKKARVRDYQSAGQSQEFSNEFVYMLYAVTYDEAGEKKTFFLALELQRSILPTGQAQWRLQRANGAARPDGFE